MATRTFPIEFRGVTFDVTVEYHADDKEKWVMVCAVPQTLDTDWLGFFQADSHTYAEIDRLCDINQREFADASKETL